MILTLLLLALLIVAVAVLAFCYGYLDARERDFLWRGVRFHMDILSATKRGESTSVWWYARLRKEPPERTAIVFEGRSYSFADIEEATNRIAHFILFAGLRRGETMALYMLNKPEYFFTWLGAAKVGVPVALINHNLRKDALVHSLTVSGCKSLVLDAELIESVREVLPQLANLRLKFFCYGENAADEIAAVEFAQPLSSVLAKQSSQPVPKACSAAGLGVKLSEPLLFIYTSGTTGLPKAAIINHQRFRAASNIGYILFDISREDRLYTALPLYHSAGGIMGMGCLFSAGASVVIRRKFSASKFWEDVYENNCTVIQYIGELCRYLLAQRPNARDGAKPVRLAVGNGLRPEIWKEFKQRFNIQRIGEFYAATEGAAGLFNCYDRDEAVGYMPDVVAKVLGTSIVKFDIEEEVPVRNSRGLCIPSGTDEPGEFLVRVRKIAGVSNFSGYNDAEATKKKLIRNVFRQGDLYFRSGDMLRRDSEGFVYFVDRIGDTFRWKGENVATSEVAKVITSFSDTTSEPNVYGVTVGSHDGRAGMVALAHSDRKLSPQDIDFAGLAQHLKEQLPSYAIPLFVRILSSEMDITGTFKHRKNTLQEEGFDPRRVKDPLFFFNGETYVPITPALYADIMAARVRL